MSLYIPKQAKPVRMTSYVFFQNVPKQAKHLPQQQKYKYGMYYCEETEPTLTLKLTCDEEKELYQYNVYNQTLVEWMNRLNSEEQFVSELWKEFLL